MINDSELVYVTNEPWSKSSLNIMNLLTGKKRVILSKSSGDHTKLFYDATCKIIIWQKYLKI